MIYNPPHKIVIQRVLPIGARKLLAHWLFFQKWIPLPRRSWWGQQLLSDLARRDPNTYHRFLWKNHMAYALTYEIDQRFGEDNLHKTRQMFVEDLVDVLRRRGIDPAKDVHSVLDVGCSLGYTLHYLATKVFVGAEILDGIDIDNYAISEGQAYLDRLQSRVHLTCADMEHLDEHLGETMYDVIISTGVLMYLHEAEAGAVVAAMLRHAKLVIGLSGPADHVTDNGELDQGWAREEDDAFIHNFDAMVSRAGGTVIMHRWEGPRLVDGNTVYFIFAKMD